MVFTPSEHNCIILLIVSSLSLPNRSGDLGCDVTFQVCTVVSIRFANWHGDRRWILLSQLLSLREVIQKSLVIVNGLSIVLTGDIASVCSLARSEQFNFTMISRYKIILHKSRERNSQNILLDTKPYRSKYLRNNHSSNTVKY